MIFVGVVYVFYWKKKMGGWEICFVIMSKEVDNFKNLNCFLEVFNLRVLEIRV